MGKTSLASSVLHHEAIISKYQRRLFVSCEGIPSLDALISEVCNVLRLGSEQRDHRLYDTILQALSQSPTLICFDNFETVWEPEESRVPVEDFLAHVAAISNLGLIVTMRGSERPAELRIKWTLHRSLSSLTDDDARQLFEEISGKWDDYCEKLIDAVDRIPLAITILSHLVAKEWESSRSVWERWNKKHTAAVRHGGSDHRLSSLEASIEVSLSSPRIQSVPSAKALLAVLALLPDGLRYTDDFFERVQSYVPSIELSKAAEALTSTSLAYPSRHREGTVYLRLLSPIREYILSSICLRPSGELKDKIITCFSELLADGWSPSDSIPGISFVRKSRIYIIYSQKHSVMALCLLNWQPPWSITPSGVSTSASMMKLS